MERAVNIAKNQQEAHQWDIKQAITMTPEERQKVAATLKHRVYGPQPDVKAWHQEKE